MVDQSAGQATGGSWSFRIFSRRSL